MKAIIPVAGMGTRLRPHTHTMPKALVQVAGKPILGHILDEIVPLGIRDVVLIIGAMGERIRDYVAAAYPMLTPCYVHQEETKGIGHALWLARGCVDEDPALIVLGDTVVTADFRALTREGGTRIGVREVPNPRLFGVVEVDGERVVSLVEKPDVPPSNLAIVGLYYVAHTALLIDCLNQLVEKDIRTKGEYQLTDALKMMLERGEEMRTFTVEGWYDCGRPETLLETNRFLLTRSAANNLDIPGSIVIPPVSIDPSAVIERSVVGPYASVAARSIIRDSIVRDSILNADSRVEGSLLDRSLIGEHAVVKGYFQKLNVGDSSEIETGD